MTCKTCGPDGCSDRVACPREYEAEAQYNLIERQGEILRAVVTAVRGAHPDGGRWSAHDAAELVHTVVAERDALAKQLEAAMQQAAEAVGSGGVRAALRTGWSDPAAAPRQPLTDEQIYQIAFANGIGPAMVAGCSVVQFARAVLELAEGGAA